MLSAHLDDVTLDVMKVGDGQQNGVGHLFVVAALQAVIRDILELGAAMHWSISVIDIQETAQRNLQNTLAVRAGHVARASAALVLLDQNQALLTISAHGELFYTRRFAFPDGFLAYSLLQEQASFSANPAEQENHAQRFLVEVQRSLDLWDRVWSAFPLHSIRVHAGEQSQALASWLSSQLGQPVLAIDLDALFPGFEAGDPADKALCLPLLGLLLRDETRTL
jgi:MSHA biogenesis protein MshI